MHPSGTKNNVKLIILETEDVYFEIEGKALLAVNEGSENYDATYCFRRELNEIPLKLFLSTQPLLFEVNLYQIYAYSKDQNKTLTLSHEHPQMLQNITHHSIGGHHSFCSGGIDFNSNIGLSDFEIKLDEVHYGTLTVEVFPSKLDYKRDYLAMIQDVSEELYNLSFDYLKKTYMNMTLIETDNQTKGEYLRILEHVFENLEKALKRIARAPHHHVQMIGVVKPFHKIRKSSKTTRDWLRKRSQNLQCVGDHFLPEKALTVERHTNYDTYENQFLKFMLLQIQRKLELTQVVMKNITDSRYADGRLVNQQIVDSLENYCQRVKLMLKFQFLQQVSVFEKRDSNSLVLIMADGYKDVFKYYQMLNKGLRIESDLFKLSLKDVAELYEYWCFIAINKILRKHYQLISHDLIQMEHDCLKVRLKKGVESKVVYENVRTLERFEIYYNKAFREGMLNQKPDNVIKIEKQQPKVTYHFVFDAKYRIDFALPESSYKKTYITPGPKEDDINTMHRYRDAIVHQVVGSSKYEQMMFGAYVLFPYSDESTFINHKFYKSIELYNIGAFPMLPSVIGNDKFGLFESFIVSLIEESPRSSFVRRLPVVGEVDYLQSIDFTRKDTLIGMLSSKEQLVNAIKYNFYHKPLRRNNESIQNSANQMDKEQLLFEEGMIQSKIKYVAIYQSKRFFGEAQHGIHYEGKVKKVEIVKRSAITEMPLVAGRNGEELYLKYYIENWTKVENIIRYEGDINQQGILTSHDLFLDAETLADLAISDIDTYLIWKEFKRLGFLALEEINFSDIMTESFTYKNLLFKLSEDRVTIISNDKIIKVIPYIRFKSERMAVIKEIVLFLE